MNVTTIGLDLAKNVFQVHGADAKGRMVFKKRLSRSKVLSFFANLPPCLIGMEACGWCALLGTGTSSAGSRGPLDAAAICQTIRQTQQT